MPKEGSRRRFLKQGAALAGLAIGGRAIPPLQGAAADEPTIPLRGYGDRSHFVTSVRTLGRPNAQIRNPIQEQTGIITPAGLHYVLSHGEVTPDIDPQQHRLMIHGMVDRPLILTLEEIKRLPAVTRVHFVECASNTGSHVSTETTGLHGRTAQETHGWTSCSEWTGVPLSLLLNEAGLQKGASWVIAEGAERRHHNKSIPMEKALDDCLVAYGQNGEPVRPDNGYPLRLLVPGWEGVNNIKWLRRIKVVDQPYMNRMESPGYTSLRADGKARWFQFELPPVSVITRPSGGQHLPKPGFYEIVGLAWSGAGAIRRVEVSTDGGRSWKEAHIQEPVHRKAHTLFRLPWSWDGKETVVQSRCTDELGQVQPTLAEFSKVWGVVPDYFRTTNNYINHFNPIWPWGITSDGSVYNALFS